MLKVQREDSAERRQLEKLAQLQQEQELYEAEAEREESRERAEREEREARASKVEKARACFHELEDATDFSLDGCFSEYGAATAQHARPTMEDEHATCAVTDRCAYFAVYDGHGGRQVASFLKNNMHALVKMQLNRCGAWTHASIKQALLLGFEATDQAVRDRLGGGARICGSTVGVLLVERKKQSNARWLYSANVGDVRAVLCRGSDAVRLSEDHKASVASERERIERLGGVVSGERVAGVLAVSRAMGDFQWKRFITSRPFVTATRVEEDDTHVVLACDGLWDVMGDQEVCSLIRSMPDDASGLDIAQQLVVCAMERCSTDNITVQVIKL